MNTRLVLLESCVFAFCILLLFLSFSRHHESDQKEVFGFNYTLVKPLKCDFSSPWYSQYRQDELYWKVIGKNLKRRGVYVDLAANDASSLSNSFYLDRCERWRGLCIEASPRYFSSLYLQRTCTLVPLCISNSEHDASFVDAGLYGGVVETNKNLVQNHEWQREAKKASRINVRCVTMATVLAKESWITRIDVFSLDVEGHELAVLQGFPWERNVTVDLFIMEPNDTAAEAFLMARGYYRIPIDGSDTWFMSEDLLRRVPNVKELLK